MAFCRYCGASLAEGQTCTCPQSQAGQQSTPVQQPVYQQPVYQQPAQPQQPSAAQQQAAATAQAAQEAAKNIGSYLKDYFTNADQAVRTVVEQDNLTFAIILTVIRALAMGLAVYGLLRKACAIALQTAMMATGGFGMEMISTRIEAPLVGSLLYGALIGLAGMALYILMVFVLMKLQKGGASLRAVYEASAANGVLPTALLLLVFLASFVSMPFAVLCLVLAGLSWVVCGVLTAQLLCADNVSGKFWVLYFVGVVLVFWASGLILPNLFLGAVGGIKVSAMGEAPFTLKQSIDAAKMQIAQMGGWSYVFRELWSELF
jgi:hypothetical protein